MRILTFTYPLEVFKFEKQNIGLIMTFPEIEDVRPERCPFNRTLVGPNSPSGRFVGQKFLLLMSVIKPNPGLSALA